MRGDKLLLLCGLLFSGNSFATSFLDRDVGELFEGSDSVLEGKVVGIQAECDKAGCTSEIKISVERTYKGNEAKDAVAKFCSAAPLSIGFSYIFFVEPVEKGASHHVKCTGVVERDGVFSRFEDAVYRYMSPGSFKMTEIDRDEYLTGWILVKEFDKLNLRIKGD